jgi:hypothetical protein
VVVNALCLEIELSGAFRVKFEADDTETFALDETYRGEGLKGFGGVLKDLVVNRCITGIRDLNSLIDRFIWTTAGEDNVFSWVNLDHWNEGLRSRRERMSN